MVHKHNNQLPNNLPQLQNLIKRDPSCYKDEFNQQYRHFSANLELFLQKPSEYNKTLDDLAMFLAQVANCYPEDLSKFPQQIMDLLQQHYATINPEIRMTFCKSLILLRGKNFVSTTALLSLFFQLLKCQDNNLRTFLQTNIINDIKNINSKSKNIKINTALQNFMFTMLKDSSAKAAKMSLDIMINLYRKNVWNDVKTVNVLTTACFSKVTKIMVAALKFFLTADESKAENDSDEDSEDEKNIPNPAEILAANKVNKKNRKREKQLIKAKRLLQKRKHKNKAPVYNFSALHLIHDPQGMAEKLFAQLERCKERFEVKLMLMELVSRLIGVHQLMLLNFYPFLQRFLQPHQKEVTKILQCTAQSAHELVPPDVLESVISTLVNNFVTERNSGDVMAVGLNTIRELCARCPLAMSSDLLHDLVQYRTYRERSVMMAASSILALFREIHPDLLHKKLRGQPTEALLEKQFYEYGALEAKSYVPGAEILSMTETPVEGKDGKQGKQKKHSSEVASDSDSESEWVDVSHSEDELCSDMEGEEETEEEDGVGSSEDEDGGNTSQVSKNSKSVQMLPEDKSSNAEQKVKGHQSSAEERLAKAKELSSMRIFTDEDFQKIEANQVKKHLAAAKRNSRKRKADVCAEEEKRGELVSLNAIEKIYKKPKTDRDAKLESAQRGRDGEKYGSRMKKQNPHASTSNKEKRKKKNFMMIKHKLRLKTKIKTSFKDKQVKLRNTLLKQMKMR